MTQTAVMSIVIRDVTEGNYDPRIQRIAAALKVCGVCGEDLGNNRHISLDLCERTMRDLHGQDGCPHPEEHHTYQPSGSWANTVWIP